MATIGTFKKAGEDFTGTINTLTLSSKVSFRPSQSDSEKGPQFRLFAGKVEIGAAWTKSSKEGKPYLSCKIDDPRFLAPVYCSLTEDNDNPGTHSLIWSRRSAD